MLLDDSYIVVYYFLVQIGLTVMKYLFFCFPHKKIICVFSFQNVP